MAGFRKSILRVAPQFQPLFREIGLDADAIFTHELIAPWRRLPDRENCTLDFTSRGGESIRWHIKRYTAMRYDLATPAQREVNAFHLLSERQIPTVVLVGWGQAADGRSFVITEDLADYDASDKLIRNSSIPFDRLLEPTADLAAKLHTAGLHHRDLYLCHFFSRMGDDAVDIRLIDVARVRPLPGLLTRRRWVVKDLAQFWFSSTELSSITDGQRAAWLDRYAQQRSLDPRSLRSAIERKSAWIARHDAKLRHLQPNRNISIPAAE